MHEPFRAEIIQIEDIALETKRFRFRITEKVPEGFSAGQFFLLALEGNVNRAYSIASSPAQMPEFELLIKHVENGVATSFLWESQTGDMLTFRGPLGRFGLKNPEAKQLLVATGTGLAPMRSFWQSLLSQENPPKIHLLFGVRNEDFVFCEEELKILKKEHSSFSYTLCLSRPSTEGDFFIGRVTDCARTLDDEHFKGAQVSLCGSKPMVDEMKEILTEKEVPAENIGVESW